VIVEPGRRPRRSPRLGASRELALGLVAMSLLTAVLLGYFLGFYCDGRDGWPCATIFTAAPEVEEETVAADEPSGMALPAATVPAQLVPSQLFPPTVPAQVPTPYEPPTAAPLPTATALLLESPTSDPFGVPPESTSPPFPTPRTPEATASGEPFEGTLPPGAPTNTLMAMPSATVTGTPTGTGPTPPGGYSGPGGADSP